MAKTSHPPVETAGPSWAGARFNVALSVLSMLAIVVMVNYISMRHPHLKSLSADRYQPLSSVTVQVLKTITNDVDIILFFDPERPLFSHVETLLRQYRDYNPHLRLETVDYLRHPARAEDVKNKFNLGPNTTDAVLFVGPERLKIIRQSELSEYNTDDLIAGRTKTVTRKAFRGEAHFTSALLAVTRAQIPEVRYLTGFGDYHNPTNFSAVTGYSSFSRMVSEHNAVLGAIDIRTHEIPASCKLLIVAGVSHEIPDAAQAKLDRYLENGGRMLVLFRINANSGLERLLYRWGIEVQNKLVIDRDQTTEQSYLIVNSDGYGSHPIVRPLRQELLPLLLFHPRPIRST